MTFMRHAISNYVPDMLCGLILAATGQLQRVQAAASPCRYAMLVN